LMLVLGKISPRDKPFVQVDSGDVDMTPWAAAKPAGLILVLIVLSIYAYFADFSILEESAASLSTLTP